MTNPTILKTYNGANYEFEATLASDEPLTVELFDANSFAWSVYPSMGTSVLVEFSTSSRARLNAGTALFRTYGTLNSAGGDESLTPYTALRFTANGGTAIVDMVQK